MEIREVEELVWALEITGNVSRENVKQKALRQQRRASASCLCLFVNRNLISAGNTVCYELLRGEPGLICDCNTAKVTEEFRVVRLLRRHVLVINVRIISSVQTH